MQVWVLSVLTNAECRDDVTCLSADSSASSGQSLNMSSHACSLLQRLPLTFSTAVTARTTV